MGIIFNHTIRVIILIDLLECFLFLGGCGQRIEKTGAVPTIEWWVEPNPIRQEQLRLFNEAGYPFNVKMQVISGSGMVEKVLSAVAGGSPPDVFFIMDHVMPDFTSRGVLEPLDEFIKKDLSFNKNDYHKVVLEAYQFNGVQFALPGNCTPIVLYYNKDLFNKAGIEYPSKDWTWGDMLEIAKRLTNYDDNGRTRHFGIIFEQASIMLFMMMWQNGGEFYNEDGTKCIVDSPENRETLTFLRELGYTHKVTPIPSDFQSVIKEDFFDSGLVAMMPSGRWKTIALRKKKNVRFGIAPVFHQKKKANLLISMGWAIPAGARHKKEAWEFIKFLSGPVGQKVVMESGDGVPVFLPLAKSDEFLKDPEYNEKYNSVYLESLGHAHRHPISPYITTSEMMSIFTGEVEKFNLGMQTVEKSLQNVGKNINRIIEENMRKKFNASEKKEK